MLHTNPTPTPTPNANQVALERVKLAEAMARLASDEEQARGLTSITVSISNTLITCAYFLSQSH